MEKLSHDPLLHKYFFRVTNEFVECMRIPSKHKEMFSHLMSMIKEQRGYSENADSFLRDIINQNVYFSNDSKANRDHFPGPMAVSLGRKHLKVIKDNDYFITEKSDGIRVLFLMMHQKTFPRWRRKDSARPFSLVDNCAIETTVQHCLSSNTERVRIRLYGDDPFGEPSSYLLNVDFNTSPPVISLEDNQHLHQLVNDRIGWCFSFLCDRTFNFYLCAEEFVFPTYESMKNKWKSPHLQKVTILDGEIVKNLLENRYNFTVYDIVTMCLTVPEKGAPGKFHLKVESMINLPMTKRYEAIQHHVVEPHHYFYKQCGRYSPPKSLQLIKKHFYKKENLNDVYNCIQKDPESGEFLYKKYNRNDGLVFTPTSERLYKFQPGSCNFLLKWKWPEKLTCDWRIEFAEYDENQCPLYRLFFSAKDRPIFYKVVSMQFDPKGLAGTDNIAECGFDPSLEQWYVLNMRNDKTNPNAFKTIASTLENVLENVTVDDLRTVCLSAQTAQATSNVLNNAETDELIHQRLIDQEGAECYTFFKLNSTKDGSMQLQYCIPHQLFSRNPTSDWWFNYIPLFECLGPQGQREYGLKSWVQERMQPPGDSYVACLYCPSIGKWKICEVYNAHCDCSAERVLSRLERMIIENYKMHQGHEQNAVSYSPNGTASGDATSYSPQYADNNSAISYSPPPVNSSANVAQQDAEEDDHYEEEADNNGVSYSPPPYSSTTTSAQYEDEENYEPNAKRRRV